MGGALFGLESSFLQLLLESLDSQPPVLKLGHALAGGLELREHLLDRSRELLVPVSIQACLSSCGDHDLKRIHDGHGETIPQPQPRITRPGRAPADR
jgi:hypothetical protein